MIGFYEKSLDTVHMNSLKFSVIIKNLDSVQNILKHIWSTVGIYNVELPCVDAKPNVDGGY